MQVFICEKSPIEVCEAMKTDRVRMNKQVIEAKQIISTISGYSKSLFDEGCFVVKKESD